MFWRWFTWNSAEVELHEFVYCADVSLEVGGTRKLLVALWTPEVVYRVFVLHVAVQRASAVVCLPATLKQIMSNEQSPIRLNLTTRKHHETAMTDKKIPTILGFQYSRTINNTSNFSKKKHQVLVSNDSPVSHCLL